MFQEAVSFALEFIGIRSEDGGCASSELGEFLLQDVAPYSGQSPSATFRDAIALLLLAHHKQYFTVFQLPAMRKSNREEASSNNTRGEVELGADEANDLLEKGLIQWDATVSASANVGQQVMLSFRPTRLLRERTLGLTLSPGSTMDRAARYMCDNALLGWSHVTAPTDPTLKKEFKAYLVTQGMRHLKNRQLISQVYLMEKTPKTSVTRRFFPCFALPLSEPEKAECNSAPAVSVASATEDAVTAVGLGPAEYSSYRQRRGNQPLGHYFARKRAQEPSFPPVVFDLGLVRYLVTTSPGHKLLKQDAMHAILTSHGVFDASLSKSSLAMMVRALGAVGLRSVKASIVFRGRRRAVYLIVPVEELLRRVNRRQRQEQRRLRGATTDTTSEDEEERRRAAVGSCEGGASDGEEMVEYDETGVDEDGEDNANSGDENDSYDGRGNKSRGCASSQLSRSQDDGPAAGGGAAMGGASGWGLGTAKGRRAAFVPMYMSPDFPIDQQACEEAERRPLAALAVLPKAQLGRQASHGPRLAAFKDTYGTIEEHSVVEDGNKAFSLVYTPAEGVKLDVKELSPSDGFNEADRVKHESATPTAADSDVAKKANTVAPGVSRYAVDVVMTTLRAAPRGATTMVLLGRIIDPKALARRIVPYLRSAGLVVSTGVSTRDRRRVGIVSLPHVKLSEQDKLELAAEERSGRRDRQDLSMDATSTLVRHIADNRITDTRPMRSDIVLDEVPAVAEGTQSALVHSRFGLTAAARAAVAKAFLVRNGYAKYSLFRAGRLHLELWKQWHDLVATHNGGSTLAPEHTPMSLREVYANMSLSTFCIIVGFSAFDLTMVLGEATAASLGATASSPTPPPARGLRAAATNYKDQKAASEKRQTCISDFFSTRTVDHTTGVGISGDTSAGGAGLVSWATPLRALPPSVRELCDRQGEESLRHALQILQEWDLIRCSTAIDPFMSDPLMSLSITLNSVAEGSNHHSYILYSTSSTGTGPALPSGSTAASTAYTVLRYWLPKWAAVNIDRRALPVTSAIRDVDDNLSVPRLVAIAKTLRVNVDTAARCLYQDGEWERVGRRRTLCEFTKRKPTSRLGRQVRPAVRLDTRRRVVMAATAMSTVAEKGGNALSAGVVEAVLLASLSRDNPRRRLEESLRLLDRVRRRYWLHRPFSRPDDSPRLSVSSTSRRGMDWLMHRDPSAWIGLGGITTVADRTALRVLGDAAVNPQYPRMVMHAGVLACTATQTLLSTQMQPNGTRCGGNWVSNNAANHVEVTAEPAGGLTAPSSRMDYLNPNVVRQQLEAMIQSIFSPNALSIRVTNTSGASTTNTAMATVSQMTVVGTKSSRKRDRQPQNETEQWVDDQQEIALDALRMILLSDMAHYSCATAKTLLYAFRPGVVLRARSQLQKGDSFRSGASLAAHRGRIPQLALATRPYVLPNGTLRSAPRPCANAALLHAWATSANAAATACARGKHGRHFLVPSLLNAATSTTSGASVTPFSAFDVSLRRQPVMDVNALVADVARCRAEDEETGGSTAEQAARRRTEATLRALRLPSLAWPAQAMVCEAAQIAQEVRERVVQERVQRRRGRGTAEDDEESIPQDGSAAATADCGAKGSGSSPAKSMKEEPVDEDEDDDEGVGVYNGSDASAAAAETAPSLYPSRLLTPGLHRDDAAALEAIPVAGPVTEMDRMRVQRAIAVLQGSTDCQCAVRAYEEHTAAAEGGTGGSGGTGAHSQLGRTQGNLVSILSGLSYPSIFHHVDGTFNEYVWRYMLLVVYHVVVRVGVAPASEIYVMLTVSGLIGPRAVRAVLDFLCDSGVLTASSGPEKVPPPVSRSPFAPSVPAANRTFAAAATEERSTAAWMTNCSGEEAEEVYYSVTVNPSGLWDITRL